MARHLAWLLMVIVCVVGCDKQEDGAAKPEPGSAKPEPGSAAATPPAAKATPPATTPPATTPPVTTPPATTPPAPPVADAATFKVGDAVFGMWTNGQWYPGKIAAVNANGTFRVNYNDGDVSPALPLKKLKTRKASAAKPGGGRTNPAASDAPCPGPGITRRCNGVCVNIQENNNHCGGCNNRCPDGKTCDGHLFCRDAEGNL